MTETAMEGERGAASRALRGLGRFLLRTKLYWGLLLIFAIGVLFSPVTSSGRVSGASSGPLTREVMPSAGSTARPCGWR